MRLARHRLPDPGYAGFGVTAGCSELNAALIPLSVAIAQAKKYGVDPSDPNLQGAQQFYDQYYTSTLGDIFNPLIITSQTQCDSLVAECNTLLAALNGSVSAAAGDSGQTYTPVAPSGAGNPAPAGSGLLPSWLPWLAGAAVIVIGAGVGLGYIKEFHR